MSWTSPARHTKRTRKPHWCDYCNERINEGEPSVSWVYRDGPVDSYPCRVHPECYDETDRRAAEEGGVFEFVPGENPRPGKEEP